MESIFKAYEIAVEELLGARPSKRQAINLSANPCPGLVSAKALRDLFDALYDHGWKKQVGSNWEWRESVPNNFPGSEGEVALERAIAKLDTNIWTCQMSTSSGVQPNGLNRRRAIDLVRFNGSDRYAFIELKVDSDNPLYAAFEILGYALAFLHAKRYHWHGMGCHDVFRSRKIELTILGPAKWYKYKTRSGEELPFEFEWLAADIANSLNTLSRENPKFSMEFRQFPGATAKLAAASIKHLAEKW